MYNRGERLASLVVCNSSALNVDTASYPSSLDFAKVKCFLNIRRRKDTLLLSNLFSAKHFFLFATMHNPLHIPSGGGINHLASPSDPDEHPPAPETLPAGVQLGLHAVYGRAPETPAAFHQQVLSAATQAMLGAGMESSTPRQLLVRHRRRIRLPIAAGLAASLLLVCGAWLLLTTIGGSRGPAVTGSAAETFSAKETAMLISKMSPGDVAGPGRPAASGRNIGKEAEALNALEALKTSDADGSGKTRELSSKDAELRVDELTASNQHSVSGNAATASNAAASTSALPASTEASLAPVSHATPAQAPIAVVQMRPSAGSPAPGGPASETPLRDATGDAGSPKQRPAAAAPAPRQAGQSSSPLSPRGVQPAGASGTPAVAAAGGTAGAAPGDATAPTVQATAPVVGQGEAKRADGPVVKPNAAAWEQTEALALDVVDAFRLAWVVQAQITGGKPATQDELMNRTWISSARRDIDANGVVDQTDVDVLLRELVKVPAVTPAANDASGADVQFDVVFDTGKMLLAGYQLEIIGQGKAVRVVSVGAGTSVAFSEPPTYDGVSLGLPLGGGDSHVTTNIDAPAAKSVGLKFGLASPPVESSATLRLAAVSLKHEERLPRGQVTAARVTWRTADGAEPAMAVRLLAAVDAAGNRMEPKLKLVRVKSIKE